jgi:DNA-binding SARP family transcriptional activator/class 3 adenylate cyclase
MADATSPRFCLSLLGRFELTGPGGVVDLPSKKLAALLAYLACTAPKPQRRETLSTLLWGSNFDAQARQSLRQALFRLRKVLGQDAIEGDGEGVSLNSAAIQCDVSRFETLIREGSHDGLSAAAELYRGPLVDDIALSEEGWSEWLIGERKRLLQLALGAVVGLGKQELAAGRAEHALKAGQRAIALNRMREDAHRLIVAALGAAGRKAEALRHYEALVALLKTELSTEPDAATRSLVAELRSIPSADTPPTVDESAPPAPVDGPTMDALPLADADPEQQSLPGSSATHSDGASSAVRSASPERRQLTIMACCLVGRATTSGRLDPEDMRDQIATFHQAVADAVAPFDGYVAQYLSDGVLVYFGYPAAHELDAERAVHAGLALVDLVGTRKGDVPLQAKAGIASGLVVVGEQAVTGDTRQHIAVGDAPVLAVQLRAAAAPGEVVIAASTRRLVGRIFDCRALAANRIGGLPRSVEAWQVHGETTGISRFEARRTRALSPFVGRQEEMERLLRRWDQAKRGEGRVVLLSGEPGIGKSRIAESLLASVEGEPHSSLRYFCSPYRTHSPLYPFIAQIEQVASFEPGSRASAKLDKLEALLKPTARNVPQDMALIAELLSVPTEGRYPALAVSPQQKREMTFTALLDQIDGAAARSPVLIVLEDIHWIDPTSLELIDRMIARAAELPILLVLTFRPELQPTWVGQPHVTMLTLSRLGPRESAGIIAGVTRGKALPDPVVAQVLARTDGVPLFIEELTSTLIESGLLRETTDRYVLDGPLPRLAIPTTLQASLVARLDRLGPVKDVAQIGAAIGREFSHELVAAVSALAPIELDPALGELTASGLVSRRGTPPDAAYSFKHALVQDAAYGTLLRSRRRQLHGSIAEVLVDQFPATAESQPEVIAHHFTEAGVAGEAIGYWIKAGRLAAARSANREAVASFERALHLLETQPETRERLELAIDLRFDLRTAHFQLGEGFERILAYLHEAEGLARRLNDQRRLGQLSDYLCHVRINSGHPREAIGFGQNAQAIAESLGDVALQVTANLNLGWAYHFAADDRTAEQLIRKVLGLLEGDRRRERFGQTIFPAVAGLGFLTWILAEQGRFTEAIARGEEALRLAEELDHPYSMAIALWCLARPHIVRGDFGDAVGLLERGVALSRERNLMFLSVLNTMGLGYGYALSGRLDEAIVLLKQALKGDEAAREQAMLPLCLIFLGEAYVLAGRLDDALPLVRRALTLAIEHDQGGYEVRALYLLGEIAARSNSHQQAEAHYRDALALAEKIHFRPLAAHCHRDLGKLYRRTGAREQGRKHASTAAAMYRDMGMTYWLTQAEAGMPR